MELDIESGCQIGVGVAVWPGSVIRSGARIGDGTSIGRNVYIGPGVIIGSNCKIQNGALIYEPSILSDGVFIGPGVILTNDRHPRARNSKGLPKTEADWSKEAVNVGKDASIGAGVICVAPVTIGQWAMIAAGSVVTGTVPEFALVAGAPARQIGWVGKNGRQLVRCSDGELRCTETGTRYMEKSLGDGSLVLVEKLPNSAQ